MTICLSARALVRPETPTKKHANLAIFDANVHVRRYLYTQCVIICHTRHASQARLVIHVTISFVIQRRLSIYVYVG